MTFTNTYDMTPKKYSLSKKQCLKIGGHCYERTNFVIDTLSPIYTRICKHCGHKQEGFEQPSVNWHDV